MNRREKRHLLVATVGAFLLGALGLAYAGVGATGVSSTAFDKVCNGPAAAHVPFCGGDTGGSL